MELLTLILLTALVGFFALRYFFSHKLYKFDKLGIINIKPLPILGNMGPVLFRREALIDYVNQVYKLREDADYVGFYDFSDPVIMIRSPELIKSITIKNFDHFVDHRGFVDAERDPLFGKNLFSLRGSRWRETRTLLAPAFSGSKMKAMFKLMWACGKNFSDYFDDELANGETMMNMKDSLSKYTNDVIATCAFGICIDSLRNPKNDFYVLGRRATNLEEGPLSLKFFLLRSFPKISEYFNIRLIESEIEVFFSNLIKETIETRDREGINRPDMIQLLMESRGNMPGGKPDLTIEEMTAQAFVFFFAGFDTTSTTMCFVTYTLAINNDAQKKVQKEIDDVLKVTNGEPTYDDIQGMQYLDAVITESMRMYPTAAFLDRRCIKRFELPPAFPGANKITLEPGDSVWLPVRATQTNPKYFANPDKFDPERFIGDQKKKIDPVTYLPFGQGPRMCIGNRFAMLEIKVVLFHLLAKCNLKPSPKTIVPMVFSTKTLAIVPKGGFWLQVEPRKNVVQ